MNFHDFWFAPEKVGFIYHFLTINWIETEFQRISYLGDLCSTMFGNTTAAPYDVEEEVCRDWFQDAYSHCVQFMNPPVGPTTFMEWFKEILMNFASYKSENTPLSTDIALVDHSSNDNIQDYRDVYSLTNFTCKRIFSDVIKDYITVVTMCEERERSYNNLVNILLIITTILSILASTLCFYLITFKYCRANRKKTSNVSIQYSGCTNYLPRTMQGNGEVVKYKPLFKFKITKESSLYNLILSTIKNDPYVLQNIQSSGDGDADDLEYCYFLFEVISCNDATEEYGDAHELFSKYPEISNSFSELMSQSFPEPEIELPNGSLDGTTDITTHYFSLSCEETKPSEPIPVGKRPASFGRDQGSRKTTPNNSKVLGEKDKHRSVALMKKPMITNGVAPVRSPTGRKLANGSSMDAITNFPH